MTSTITGGKRQINCKDCSKCIRSDHFNTHIFNNHKDDICKAISKVGRLILPVEYQYVFLCLVCDKSFKTAEKATKHFKDNEATCSEKHQYDKVNYMMGGDIPDKDRPILNIWGASINALKRAEQSVNSSTNKLITSKSELSEANTEINILTERNKSLNRKCHLLEAEKKLNEYKQSCDKDIAEEKIKVLIDFIELSILRKKIITIDDLEDAKRRTQIVYDSDVMNKLEALKQEVKYRKDNSIEEPEVEPKLEIILETKPKVETTKIPPKKPQKIEEAVCDNCHKAGATHTCSMCNKLRCYDNPLTDCYIRDCECCKKEVCSDCAFRDMFCNKDCYVKYNK
jgi:hypothetical protein